MLKEIKVRREAWQGIKRLDDSNWNTDHQGPEQTKEEEKYDPQEYPCHCENTEFPLFSSVKQRPYCGLNENGLIYLNTWLPAGWTVWERLGGVALLKKEYKG